MQMTTTEDTTALASICARVPGWSDAKQFRFFRRVFANHPEISDVLMLGVYHGRDICIMRDVLDRYHAGRYVRIVGVDRFSAERCADWPTWAKSWGQLTRGMPPPNKDAAQANIASDTVQLVQAGDTDFLDLCNERFDFVYVDTSHDYASVRAVLTRLKPVCRPRAVVSGDDFSDDIGWGVARAVNETFTHHVLHDDWIWETTPEDFK